MVTLHALQLHIAWGKLAIGLHILVHFVVHAALQLCALPGKLLGVAAQVLKTGASSAYTHEVLHPCSAAELASAGSETAYAACFLPRAYLLHLYSYVERIGQHLDKLAEIYTSVSDVVEDGLIAVSLILYVSYLHLKPQLLGYLSAAYHRAVLQRLRFLVLLDVGRPGLAVDAAYLLVALEVGLLHLQGHQFACERHCANVMTGVRLHGHHITFLQRQVVDIVVIPFPGILKLHLHQVGGFVVAWDIGQIVIHIELCIMTDVASTLAEAVSGTPALIFAFHIYYCLIRIIILSAKSKNTMRGFTFCAMSRWACDISSMMPIMFLSLIKGAKRSLKSFSSRVS